jgi:DNA-binding NtrC family response regulator
MAAVKLIVVDDEPSLLSLLDRFLTRAGYEVHAYGDAQAALEEYLTGPEEFAAVITDLSLPDMPGEEFVKQVRQRRPGIPTIVCSGSLPPGMDAVDAPVFLQKPFLPRALLEAVRSVAGDSAAGARE